MKADAGRTTIAWLVGPAGLFAALVWGFGEATLFFLIPDILLTASALFSIRSSLRQIGAVLAGSLIGGALMFGVAAHDPALARAAVEHVPFVGPRMFAKVDADFRTSGVWALCRGPMSGVPYKVYSVEAPPRAGWFAFLLVSIPARLERLVGMWSLFALLGVVFRRRIQACPMCALGLHGLFWIAIYVYYWSVI